MKLSIDGYSYHGLLNAKPELGAACTELDASIMVEWQLARILRALTALGVQ